MERGGGVFILKEKTKGNSKELARHVRNLGGELNLVMTRMPAVVSPLNLKKKKKKTLS